MKIFLILLLSATANLFPFTATAESGSKAPTVAEKYQGIEISVNINTGTLEELSMLLSGVGEKKAQSIIDYREEHGPFTTPDELTRVKGIGPSIVEKNRERILL